MIIKVTLDLMEERFEQMGRENQFSRQGLGAILDYYEDLESDTGEETELDVIALCCEWSEYESWGKLVDDYGDDDTTFDSLLERTTAYKLPGGGYLMMNF